MADSHIDAFETVIYGNLACIEMRRTVLPMNSQWTSTVEYCIELQEAANARMEAILARIKLPKVDKDEVAKVTNTFVRFGSWLASLEGQPLDPARFFGAQAPSVAGRERLSKLTGRLEHMINTLAPHAEVPAEERIEGAVDWLRQLREAHAIAVRNRDAQRAAEKARKDFGPEVENARQAWLDTYVANKAVIEGVLRHEKRLALKSFIFDDLAEVQRSKNTEELEQLVTAPTDVTEPTGPAGGPTSSDGDDSES